MQKSLFVTASFFIAAVPFCIAQGSALHYTVPSAAAPGKTTTVTFFGENLSEATALWTSFPAKVTRVSSSETNDSGHGKVAQSWVGTGQNEEIAPDDLAKAVGADTLDALAKQTGMSRSDLLEGLSQQLPELVDQLTPHGRLPNADEAGRMV